MSERTARLDELLREEISAILAREIADPRIGFVTVTRVDVTSDLSHANVWVSVIGDETVRRQTLSALTNAMPFVRHQLGVLHIKRIPQLHVRHDDAAERATRILHILHDIETGADPEPAPPTEALPMPDPVRGTPTPAVKRTPRPTTTRRGGTASTRGAAGAAVARNARPRHGRDPRASGHGR